jgi:hypothetical protein
MVNCIAVCIGGTGVRCFESFLYSVATGQLDASQDGISKIKVMIVDKDYNCQTIKQCKTAIKSYESFRPLLTDKEQNKDYALPIVELDTRWDLHEILTEKSNRGDVKLKVITRSWNEKLVNALFSENEQDVDLVEGFYGHPSIGATLFDFIMQYAANHIPLVQDIEHRSDGNIDSETRVFVFASVFGGTGAALMPNIAKKFKKAGQKVIVSAAVMLPYFDILPASSEESDQTDVRKIRANSFYRASATALRHYHQAGLVRSAAQDQNYAFDSIYLIGKQPLDYTSDEYANGGERQFSHKHIVDMTAALAACDFFTMGNMPLPTENIFVALLSPTAAKEGDLGAVDWDNLPMADAGKGSDFSARNKMCQFMRFCSVVIQGVQLEMLRKDEYLNRDSRVLKSLFGEKGVFVKWVNCTDQQRADTKKDVSLVFEFCCLFVAYINDVVQSGRKWADKEYNSADFVCELFNRAKIEKLDKYAKSLQQKRDEDSDSIPVNENEPVIENLDELTDIGDLQPVNTNKTLTSVIGAVLGGERHKKGKQYESFALMMRTLYEACSLGNAK